MLKHRSREYQLLSNKLNKVVVRIYEYSNNEIKDVDELENKLQIFVIFDDYICDKNQDQTIKYFIQGRHTCYLS